MLRALTLYRYVSERIERVLLFYPVSLRRALVLEYASQKVAPGDWCGWCVVPSKQQHSVCVHDR